MKPWPAHRHLANPDDRDVHGHRELSMCVKGAQETTGPESHPVHPYLFVGNFAFMLCTSCVFFSPHVELEDPETRDLSM